jgi:hypothetical protein
MNRKLTVSEDIVRSRYIAEVCSGQKTAKDLALELGISPGRLSKIKNGTKRTSKETPHKVMTSKEIAEGILTTALTDINTLQGQLRKSPTKCPTCGNKGGITAALGLVDKLKGTIELALKQYTINIDARTQTVNITNDSAYSLLCESCKKRVEESAVKQLTSGQSTS